MTQRQALNVIRNNVQTLRNIDNVLALHKCKLCDFGERIFPIELEIKDTTDRDRSTSYLVLHLRIYSVGRLRTKHYEKRDDFNFPIVNFPSICSNIPAAPACEVYISQMIRYYRACGSNHDFPDWRQLLSKRSSTKDS